MKNIYDEIIISLEKREYYKASKECSENFVSFDFNQIDYISSKILNNYTYLPKDYEKIKISIVTNSTIDIIIPLLSFYFFCNQKLIETKYTGVSGYPFELINSNSEISNFKSDFTILILDDEIIWSKVEDIFDLDEVENQIDLFFETYESILKEYTSPIIGTTIILSERYFKSILDYKTKIKLSMLWRKFNLKLLELASIYNNFYLLDLDILSQGKKIYDETLAIYTEMRFTHDLFNQLAKEFTTYILASKGETKKALILDLDNTLWNGILGDDGADGISMGDNFQGKPFMIIQKLALNLKKQGVLLGICSKNDKSNVDNVFKINKDIILNEDCFSVIYANWENKSSNLMKIAKELNLNENSLVFLDDSNFEREEVRKHTQVIVIDFPNSAELVPSYILESNYFNKMNMTNEDKKRTEYIKIAKKLEKVNNNSQYYKEYLESLKMRLECYINDLSCIDRVTQLEQRTNQFNLTTRRYDEKDIKEILTSKDSYLYTFQLTDKYGSYGIISSVIIKSYNEDGKKYLTIKSFLLSCRVFSREVENKIIEKIILDAKKRGIDYLIGEYIITLKNKQFYNFYLKNGFNYFYKKENCEYFLYDLQNIPFNIKSIDLVENKNKSYE